MIWDTKERKDYERLEVKAAEITEGIFILLAEGFDEDGEEVMELTKQLRRTHKKLEKLEAKEEEE